MAQIARAAPHSIAIDRLRAPGHQWNGAEFQPTITQSMHVRSPATLWYPLPGVIATPFAISM
jgi:hypothetical protein